MLWRVFSFLEGYICWGPTSHGGCFKSAIGRNLFFFVIFINWCVILTSELSEFACALLKTKQIIKIHCIVFISPVVITNMFSCTFTFTLHYSYFVIYTFSFIRNDPAISVYARGVLNFLPFQPYYKRVFCRYLLLNRYQT